jgi:hypothetical protein
MTVAVESADGEILTDSKWLRLIIEGEPGVISRLAELVVMAIDSQVTKATVYGEGWERDITGTFKQDTPAQIDPLDTGDPAE